MVRTPVTVQVTPLHTAITTGMQSTGRLTHIVLYCEVLLSQKTRPDALLSPKFPQPKLPVKTLWGEKERQRRDRRLSSEDCGGFKGHRGCLQVTAEFYHILVQSKTY